MASNWFKRFFSRNNGTKTSVPLSKTFRPTLEVLESRLAPATHTWIGAAGALWSNPANWEETVAPAAGEANLVLTFKAGAANQANVNDIANLNITTITIADDYTLSGTGAGANIKLSGNVSVTSVITAKTIVNLNIQLATTRTFDVASGKELELGGVISGVGAAGLTKTSNGILTFTGGASNTYTGTTTVNGGNIFLHKNIGFVAIAGPLVVGDGTGFDEVRYLESDQIGNSVAVTVAASGRLNLNGVSDAIGSLTVTGNGTAAVATAAGTLTLNGPITSNASSDSAIISGNLNFNGVTRTITVADGGAADDLSISAVISNGGISKSGAGLLRLAGNNSYAGATSINAGTLHVAHAGALGTAAAGAIVAEGATLSLEVAPAAEALTLAGKGVGNAGALFNKIGNSNWGGPITLNATATSPEVFLGSASDTLTLSGIISGTAGLTKVGAGTLKLAGTAANTYAGATRVNDGVLELGASAVAVPHNVLIGDGVGAAEKLTLLASEQIANGAAVTLNLGSTFEHTAFSETILSLNLTGATVLGSGGTLFLGGNITANNAPSGSFISGKLDLGGANRTISVANGAGDLDLSLTGIISNGGITKTGAGKLRLAAANSYAGATNINAGTLVAGNTAALGATTAGTTVAEGATLEISQSITGEALTLNGKGVGNAGALRNPASSIGWIGNVTINATATSPDVFLGADISAALFVDGAISGSAGLTKVGSGLLSLLGSTANTFAGATRVNDGLLNLSKTASILAVPHNLIVGDGAGGADTVILSSSEQIANSAALTLNAFSFFDLGAFTETVGPVTLHSATINGTGTLILGGNVTATAALGTVNVSARIDLGNATRTFNVGDGFAGQDMILGNNISNGGLTKTGAGTLRLAASNGYGGVTTVSAGTLLAGPASLGNSVNGTVVLEGATLELAPAITFTTESLSLAGKGVNNAGALGVTQTVGGQHSDWLGPITLNATAASPEVFVRADIGSLVLGGVISGSAGLAKIGAGNLVLSGSANNTYAGVTRVKAGKLDFGDASGIAVPHNLVVGDNSGSPESALGAAIAPTAIVTINNSANWSIVSASATIAGLTLIGGSVLENAAAPGGELILTGNVTVGASPLQSQILKPIDLAGGTRTFNVANGAQADDFLIGRGVINGAVTKTGAGTLFLSNASTYAGATNVNAGVLRIGNDNALGTAAGGTTIANGASLVMDSDLSVGAESLTLIGAGAPGLPKFRFNNGLVSIWAGPVTLTATAAVSSITIDVQNLSGSFQGVISGTGGVTKLAGGDLIFAGTGANTYTGVTRVKAGRLLLNKTAGVNAIAGNLIIGDGLGVPLADGVRWLASDQIANTAAVTLNIAGLLDLNGFAESIHQLTISGGSLKNVNNLTIQ